MKYCDSCLEAAREEAEDTGFDELEPSMILRTMAMDIKDHDCDQLENASIICDCPAHG